MSEGNENLQTVQQDDTQPLKPVRKAPRWRSILLGILGFILLLALGGFGGYGSAVSARKSAEQQIISQQLSQQYEYALVDIQFGRYDAARQRLEFIIQNDPMYPGAQETLTQVLVLSNLPTATPTASPPPTADYSGAENAFAAAQQLIAAQDWPNALAALDKVRQLDPTYKASLVDGMYYFALRNYGVALIGQGNLEGGIYELTLAERFGPLDNTAHILRDNARFYLSAASFWELNWKLATEYFAQLNGSGLWDGTMTATERYYIASMRYGDQLFAEGQYCAAYTQYQNAQTVGNLDATAARNANQAYQQCYPPTATLQPTQASTQPPATQPPAATEPPATTEPPTQAP